MTSNSDGNRIFALSGLAGLLGIVALVVWWPGCRQYPAVTSPEGLQLIKLVYAACNTQEPARLQMAEERLAKGIQSGQISPREEQAFRTIIDLAKRQEWKQAEAAAFKFAQDQVGQGAATIQASHDHGEHGH